MRRRRPRAREREDQTRRRERLIIGGTAFVLVVAAIIIGFGLYFTRYLPPREVVLTVEGRDFSASDVRERGTYFMLFEGGNQAAIDQAVTLTLSRIERDEILRLRAPALVGEVTPEDIDLTLRQRLGFESVVVDVSGDADDDADGDSGAGGAGGGDDGDAEPTGEPTSTATSEATTEPSAEPTEDLFPATYAEVIRSSGVSRELFEQVLEAQILARRLQDMFREELDESGPQVLVSSIRVGTRGAADEVRRRFLAGEDFAALQLAFGPGEEAAPSDPSWVAVTLLDEPVAAALDGLEDGELSEVVERGAFLDLFLIVDREDDRELESAQLDTIAAIRLGDWLEEQAETVAIERDLSTDEERWILERIIGDLNEERERQLRAGAGGGDHN